jgi:hypothetical protein
VKNTAAAMVANRRLDLRRQIAVHTMADREQLVAGVYVVSDDERGDVGLRRRAVDQEPLYPRRHADLPSLQRDSPLRLAGRALRRQLAGEDPLPLVVGERDQPALPALARRLRQDLQADAGERFLVGAGCRLDLGGV